MMITITPVMSGKGNNQMLNNRVNPIHLSDFLPAHTPTAMATKNWVAIAAYFNKELLFFYSLPVIANSVFSSTILAPM